MNCSVIGSIALSTHHHTSNVSVVTTRRVVFMEEDYFKRSPRFNYNRDPYLFLWALRLEVLAEAKDCMDVMRRDNVRE